MHSQLHHSFTKQYNRNVLFLRLTIRHRTTKRNLTILYILVFFSVRRRNRKQLNEDRGTLSVLHWISFSAYIADIYFHYSTWKMGMCAFLWLKKMPAYCITPHTTTICVSYVYKWNIWRNVFIPDVRFVFVLITVYAKAIHKKRGQRMQWKAPWKCGAQVSQRHTRTHTHAHSFNFQRKNGKIRIVCSEQTSLPTLQFSYKRTKPYYTKMEIELLWCLHCSRLARYSYYIV